MGLGHVSMVLESPRGDLQAYQDAPVKGHLPPSGNGTMYNVRPRSQASQRVQNWD